MRYVYGITAALLLGGSVATVAIGPLSAQTAQNEPGAIASMAPRPGAPMSFADLTARLAPAVVNIATRQTISIPRSRMMPPGFEEFFRRFGGQGDGNGGSGGGGGGNGGSGDNVVQRGGSLGSGFIISADGYIVTNNHVVAPAANGAVVESITVTLPDRTEYPARVIGRDETADVAVLKIDPHGNLPFVRFGDSRQLRVGDWVIAIGDPYGLGGTVTAGIVSALRRSIGAGPYDRFIQTDASINSGNSGGPMFDLNGNVVGMNTALISPTGGNIGLGFAIPSEQIAPIVDQLRRGQRVQRGYIGVSLQPIDEGVAAAMGIERNHGELITSVTAGGPAARAGIQPGDVIIAVNGQPVTPDQTLAYLTSQQAVGARVPMEILRSGRRQNVTVTIAERPSDQELARLNGLNPNQNGDDDNGDDSSGGGKPQVSAGQRSTQEALGLTVQTLTPDLARQAGITDPSIRGVVVMNVDQNSDAAAKGLRAGDVITSVNQQPAGTPDAVAGAVAAARQAGRNTVLLVVRRQNSPPVFIGVDLQAATPAQPRR